MLTRLSQITASSFLKPYQACRNNVQNGLKNHQKLFFIILQVLYTVLFNFKEPSGNAVEITCFNCGKAVAVTQWDVHDNLCQGGYSVEQSTSMDNCVDLTTGNDNIVRDCSTSATESSRMEPSSTFNPTDDSITKVSHCFREDFKIKGCPDASSSKKGKTVSGEGSNVRVMFMTSLHCYFICSAA